MACAYFSAYSEELFEKGEKLRYEEAHMRRHMITGDVAGTLQLQGGLQGDEAASRNVCRGLAWEVPD